MLTNGNWDVIEDLHEQFNESIYLSAQEKLLQDGTENIVDEFLEVG
jgi:hypothetical protein